MDKSSLKITELPALSVASENGFIPIAQVKEENDTYKTTLRALRESIMFENAYSSTAAGVSATVPGDVFFVYTDDTKEHVQGWVNSAGGATPLLNANSEQITYGTYALLNKALKNKGAIVQWVYNGGLSNGGEQTFTVPLAGNVAVQEVYVDGLRQFKDVGFELVAGDMLSFKLATPVKENQTVVAICFGSDDIEKVNEALLSLFSGPTGAANIGMAAGGTVEAAIGARVATADLSSVYGAGLVGTGNYADLRNYTGYASTLSLYGYSTAGDGGEGIFDRQSVVGSKTDDDCVHLVDKLGRLWKRRINGNVVKLAWAGVKSYDQTTAPQDTAFKNALKAAGQLSSNGYPQSIITGLDKGVVYLAQRHYIRCGTFPESLSWILPTNSGDRFGITGRYALDQGAGWFVVQANRPLFDIEIDNTSLTFQVNNYTTAQIAGLVDTNYALRLESMVNAPDIKISAGAYAGTVLYSLGKSNYTDVTAKWPDLTVVLPSIQNLGTLRMNNKTVGRGFYLRNTGSGLGKVEYLWEQNNSQASVLKEMYDVGLEHYEDFVPPLLATGGLIIDTCGTVTIGSLLVGSGGGPHVRIWDTPAITINKIFGVQGGPTLAQTLPGAYCIEICNSRVSIGLVNAYYPGEFIRMGYNAYVGIADITGWYMSRVVYVTNDTTKLQYTGQRIGQPNDTGIVTISKGIFYNLDYYAGGYAAQPVFYVDATVLYGKMTLDNIEFYNTHSGWTNLTEDQMYIVRVDSPNPNFFFSTRNCKWDDNNFNYVIYLKLQSQLAYFQSAQTSYSRIRYGDGTQSSFGMRDATHVDLTTTALPLTGVDYVYNYRRAGKYHGDLTVPSGGTCVIKVNDQILYNYTAAGTYPLNLVLYYQERVNITITGAVTLTNSTWRYTV